MISLKSNPGLGKKQRQKCKTTEEVCGQKRDQYLSSLALICWHTTVELIVYSIENFSSTFLSPTEHWNSLHIVIKILTKKEKRTLNYWGINFHSFIRLNANNWYHVPLTSVSALRLSRKHIFYTFNNDMWITLQLLLLPQLTGERKTARLHKLLLRCTKNLQARLVRIPEDCALSSWCLIS